MTLPSHLIEFNLPEPKTYQLYFAVPKVQRRQWQLENPATGMAAHSI